jgi:hypothetical protein
VPNPQTKYNQYGNIADHDGNNSTKRVDVQGGFYEIDGK